MKKKFIVLAFAVAMIATLNGCLSKEQKEEAKKYEKQAEENAVEYVKEKYDIDARVTGSQFNRTGMFGDAVSTYVDVEMEYEDKKFDVYVVGDKEWADVGEQYKKYCCDNYQYDEIYDDLKVYVKEETNVDIEEILIWYNSTESRRKDHMTELYYDGNLEYFLEEQCVNVVIVTTDEEIGDFDSIDMRDGSLNAYSYEEDYYEEYGHTIENDNEHLCALWMNWSADVRSDKEEITEYEKKKFGLGYLVYAKECSITVSETSVDAKDWEKDAFDSLEAVSDAYKISGDKVDIYIYVKSDNDDESIGIAYEKNGKMRYAKTGREEGEYLVGVLDMKQYDGEVSVVILED